MQLLKDINFRDLEGRYALLLPKTPVAGLELADGRGCVIWTYIDHVRGLRCLCLAEGDFDAASKRLQLHPLEQDRLKELDYEQLQGCETLLLPEKLPQLEQYGSLLTALAGQHKPDEELAATRRVTNLDGSRVPGHPDEVQVYLVRGETNVCCTVRVEGIREYAYYGELLEEPELDFGVHQGQILNFYNVKNSLGIMCISIFEDK